MRSERRKQIMTLSILVVAVLVISVGFAAYSSTLRINTSATVNPNSGTFAVKFSTTQDTLTVADVIPTNYTSGLTVTNGTINNSGNPTISNLTAQFKNPGDYVEYIFYARNEGEYNAYLNNINFATKTCTAGEGATEDLVQSACNSISATVTVGGIDYTTTTGITNHILNKKTGEEIKVTLKYADNGARADGPFTVNFGEITMVYSTINDSTYKPPVQTPAACSIERQVAEKYTVGDVVTCGEEQFYVIENQNTDTTAGVDMLAMYNLTLTESPIQDTTGAENQIAFSSTTYWLDESGKLKEGFPYFSYTYTLETEIEPEVFSPVEYTDSYPYIYGNYPENNIYPYVEAYRDVLEGNGINVVDAKLLNAEQVFDLGCNQPYNDDQKCPSAPSWLYSTDYWMGTLNGEVDIHTIVYVNGIFAQAFNDDEMGIRPVITIPTSDLG